MKATTIMELDGARLEQAVASAGGKKEWDRTEFASGKVRSDSGEEVWIAVAEHRDNMGDLYACEGHTRESALNRAFVACRHMERWNDKG